VTRKPDSCAECAVPLIQPLTGRSRAYCSVPCRRLAERKVKVGEQLLARARRQEQDARAKAAQWDSPHGRSAVKFWQAEVKHCEAELAGLLAGAGDDSASDEAQASAAAATLRSRRRAS
jgi:hypothetical protein